MPFKHRMPLCNVCYERILFRKSYKPRENGQNDIPQGMLIYTIHCVYDIVKMNMMDQEDIWKY